MKEQINIYLEKYWGILVLGSAILLALVFDLLRLDAYGIDEQASRALLLNWSVSDNIINPIVIFGVPDFRALLFIPVGTYWAGSMLAAKIFSLTLGFLATTVLYRWTRKHYDSDSALIAAALFFISPLMVNEIDTLGAGHYLILGFGAIAWLDQKYRAKERYFGGWYFSIMLIAALMVTISPIGLAAPLGLTLYWLTQPDEHKKPGHMIIGLLITCAIALLVSHVWFENSWFTNPVAALAHTFNGSQYWMSSNPSLLAGLFVSLIAVAVILANFSYLRTNLLGLMLLIAILAGITQAGRDWALIVLALTLFTGIPLLMRINERVKGQGLVAKRGLVLAVSVLLCTIFMLEVKAHSYANRLQMLSPQDELIEKIAHKASDKTAPFRAASQWPGRTMLATKRDTLPLPPGDVTTEKFQQITQQLTHIVFDPFSPKNKGLSDHLSSMTGETETSVFLSSGVIVDIKNHKVESSYRAPVEAEQPSDEKNNDA